MTENILEQKETFQFQRIGIITEKQILLFLDLQLDYGQSMVLDLPKE